MHAAYVDLCPRYLKAYITASRFSSCKLQAAAAVHAAACFRCHYQALNAEKHKFVLCNFAEQQQLTVPTDSMHSPSKCEGWKHTKDTLD